MSGIRICDNRFHPSCYFRTIADQGNRKCLIQITERCNLECEHCFVSAGKHGRDMDVERFETRVVPQLVKNRFSKVTITGGEPLLHPKFLEMLMLLSCKEIEIAVCTNATLITDTICDATKEFANVHFNVSLDGFRPESHGRFRGNCDEALFDRIKSNIKLLGSKHLLHGILVTPNAYADIHEYEQICEFSKECGASYVLINPLSRFGRGSNNTELAYDEKKMMSLYENTKKYNSDGFEVTYIRFPNVDAKPLSECVVGKISYIFTNGEITVCPYMVFAANNIDNEYDRKDFIIGNIYDEEFDFDEALRRYQFPVAFSDVCRECKNGNCKKGCYATKMARGKNLLGSDELCPIRKDRLK